MYEIVLIERSFAFAFWDSFIESETGFGRL